MREKQLASSYYHITIAVLLLAACGSPEYADNERPITQGTGVHQIMAEAVHLPPIGGTYRSSYFGGPGGAPFSIRCPLNEYAIGIYGRSGSYIDQIGLICAPLKSGSGPQKIGTGHPVGVAGGAGGVDFTLVCPQPYSAMSGIAGRSGKYIDAISPICRDIADGSLTTFPFRGGSGGGFFSDEHWPGLLIRLSGQSGTTIDGIGYELQPMEFRISAKETGGGY